MIRDLLAQTSDPVLDADVHIIGAGIAGLILATRLAKAGLRVVVTESGGTEQVEETHPLNRVVHLDTIYAGAEHGRFRGLGGTSTRWGGALIPFQPSDMAIEPNRWPVSFSELDRYRPEVEKLFGLPAGPYEVPVFTKVDEDPPFVTRFAKWPQFSKRNVAHLLHTAITDPSGPEVWLNATATGFVVGSDGLLASVTAQARDGRKLTVRAQETVIAAGAIESTRLLLLLDLQNGGQFFSRHDVIGRYFHDHLSTDVGEIIPTDRKRLNRIAGFRFEGKSMRNLRFEASASAQNKASIPPCFAHVAFSTEGDGGFAALRDVFRQLQRRRAPRPRTIWQLVQSAPWLARAVWWRYLEDRLLYPDKARIELHMVMEQAVTRNNRITLSADQRDLYGQPLAAIKWSVSDDDRANLGRATELFSQYWAEGPLSEVGKLRLRPQAEAAAALSQGGGIFHPGGSTRMGATATEGVVDPALRAFAIANLSVAATSVFPTGGGANPTMMLIMSALRLADRLVLSLR